MNLFARRTSANQSHSASRFNAWLISYQTTAVVLAVLLILTFAHQHFSSLSASRNARARELMQQASGLLQARQLANAALLADSARATAGYPDSTSYLLGRIALESDSLQRAAARFRDALHANENYAEAYAGMAEVAMRQAQGPTAPGQAEKIEQALLDYRRALQLKPNLFAAQFGQANALFRRGKADTTRYSSLIDLQDANGFYGGLKNRAELYQLLTLQQYLELLDNLADLQELPIQEGPADDSYMQKAPMARDLRRRVGDRPGGVELVEAQYALLQGNRTNAADLLQKAIARSPENTAEAARIQRQDSLIMNWRGRTSNQLAYEPQFRFNRYRTGAINGDGIVIPTIKWRARVGQVGMISPVVSGNFVIQVAPDLRVIAFIDRTSGRQVRLLPKEEGFTQSTPAVSEGNLWIDAPRSYVYVVPMRRIQTLGSFEASDIKRNFFQEIKDSSPLVVGGRILFGTTSGQLRSANVSGQRIGIWNWSSALGGQITAPAAAGESLAMVGSYDSRFYGISYRNVDPTTFELSTSWLFIAADTIRASACFGKGVVYFGDESGAIYALPEKLDERRTERGQSVQTAIATFRRAGTIVSSPAIDDSLVYFCSLDSTIYALPTFDLKNRETRDGAPAGAWRPKFVYKTDGAIVSSPCITGGVLYVGTDAGEILAIDLKSRGKNRGENEPERLLWRLVVGGAVRSSPTVVDKVLYVAAEDGYLYAIGR